MKIWLKSIDKLGLGAEAYIAIGPFESEEEAAAWRDNLVALEAAVETQMVEVRNEQEGETGLPPGFYLMVDWWR